MKILLLAKSGKPYLKEVEAYLKRNFSRALMITGERSTPFPYKKTGNFLPDLLISYLSPWIIPQSVLARTKKWNINFHPGPPEYPGIGCFNFALYHHEASYGVTSHLMVEKVDRGAILAVKRFRISDKDTVTSLSWKSYRAMFLLFKQVMEHVKRKNTVPHSAETWAREPYRRTQLEVLCKLSWEMTKTEILKRVRATHYEGMPGPYFERDGLKFEFNPSR